MKNPIPELTKAAEAQAWEWLQEVEPELAAALHADMEANRPEPKTVWRRFASLTQRPEISQRVYLAASHLARVLE